MNPGRNSPQPSYEIKEQEKLKVICTKTHLHRPVNTLQSSNLENLWLWLLATNTRTQYILRTKYTASVKTIGLEKAF